MAFQDTAGGIVLDATLTDIGRKYMAKGTFRVVKFALGDDEVDYTHGNADSGPWQLSRPGDIPILEACAEPPAVIHSTLIDFRRDDVFFLPEYRLNQNVTGAVNLYDSVVYLSVNDETTTKLKSALDLDKYILQNADVQSNMVVVECGFESSSYLATGTPGEISTLLRGNQVNQERFIYNFDLYDKYAFVYCDSRLFSNLLMGDAGARFSNDEEDELHESFRPLQNSMKTSLPSLVEEQDTYHATATKNEVYDPQSGYSKWSSFKGPRSSALALNFVTIDRLNSLSNGAADLRYSKFGKLAQNLFGDGNLYDYIDSRVTIEGTATGRQIQLTVRITRFSGT